VIEALRTSILVPYDHLHINQIRISASAGTTPDRPLRLRRSAAVVLAVSRAAAGGHPERRGAAGGRAGRLALRLPLVTSHYG